MEDYIREKTCISIIIRFAVCVVIFGPVGGSIRVPHAG